MKLLKEHYSNSKIKLDLSFQRMACWPLSAKRSYISSIFNGAHPGYLILASVNANAYKNTYFKELLEENYMYLSIDGNNRSACIAEFMDDKFTVKVDKELLTYSELTINDRAQFDALSLGIVMYESIDKRGCADIFLSHNESQALSAQEKRNAQIGKISTYLRELEPKVRAKIKSFDSANKRRANDEFIVDILLSEIQPSSPLGKKDRDTFWFDNLAEIKFNKTSLRETLDLLGDFLKLKNFGKQSLEGLAKDFIITRGLMKTNNGVVVNKEKFITSLASKRTALYNSKEAYQIVSKKGKEEALQYSTLVSQPSFQAPLDRRVQLLEGILIELQAEGSINYRSKRNVNTSDPELRKDLYDRQDGVCSITGKKIEDFLDGGKWEVDHTIPIAKGGLDFIDNMQLVDMVANRRKGASL
jgi:hypothetical protein